MLEAASEQLGRIDVELLPVAPDRSHDHACGALDVPVHLRNGQAPLLALRGSFGKHDLWIDDGERPAFADVDDGHALAPADLWRGEPNAFRGVHRLEHVVDEAADPVSDIGDRSRFLTKNRVAKNADVEQTHARVDASVLVPVGMTTLAIRP